MLDFFFSLGIILLVGFLAGYGLSKIKIPGLTGMILVGLLIGPYGLKLIAPEVMSISAELRKIALVIILTRSGLNLDIDSLKKVGRPAILMCFLPATFEILGVFLFCIFYRRVDGTSLPIDSIFEFLLLGSVLAAVSPAVVSPRMIRCIEEGYGEEHQVPKLVLAGSSVDDIFVIVLFYAFFSLSKNTSVNPLSFVSIPVSILLGIGLGIGVGLLLSLLFERVKMRTVVQVIFVLASGFIMVGLETLLSKATEGYDSMAWLAVSSLLGIVVVGMVILFKNKDTAHELSKGYNQLWCVFEIILFVLVGAEVNIAYAKDCILLGCLALLVGLSFRMLGVYFCMIGTPLTFKERLFCMISYLPKATVQASIGGIAFTAGISLGETILSVAVLSILITAPVGAILIDSLTPKLLSKTTDVQK